MSKKTIVPNIQATWLHKIKIGYHCTLEKNIIMKYDGIWSAGTAINIGNEVFIGSYCEFNIRKGITIGADSLIASGCRFIDHDHGLFQS